MSLTIAALATPPGVAGLSVIRISGDEAFEIADKCFHSKLKLTDVNSHTIHYGKIKDQNTIIDTVTASVFKSPNSYTGEDVVEFGCHGGNVVSAKVLDLLYKNGASIPVEGEYTKRAFLNGKLDLLQVEAVSDLIHSSSQLGASASAKQLEGKFTAKLSQLREKLLEIAGLLELELDFSEEDLEFIDRTHIIHKINESIDFSNKLIDTYNGSNILRNGFQVAIAGFPNSGKSTLFNALLDKKRAIVSEIEGTTRDYLEEKIYISSIPFILVDTAGLRDTDDVVEVQGIKMVESVLEKSDLVVVLNDISIDESRSNTLFNELKLKYENVILIQNKTDLVEYKNGISAKNNLGIDDFKKQIFDIAHSSVSRVADALINQRQRDLLQRTVNDLKNAVISINNKIENEIVAIDLRSATKTIGALTGEEWNEEVLDKVFSGFCIGK